MDSDTVEKFKSLQNSLANNHCGDSWNNLTFGENTAEINLKLIELKNRLREAKNQSSLVDQKVHE